MGDTALELIKEMEYKMCLIKHEDKSDDELKRIVDINSKLVMALPLNATIEDLSDANKKLGENQACIEILNKRKEASKIEQELQSNIKNSKKLWKSSLPNRRKESILNLSVATTYNAQLVAAILESEDCKTEEEIFTLFNEFSEIKKEDLSELLKNLVNEEILYLSKTGKYYLINICTEDLFPLNPIDWATKKLLLNNEEIGEEEIKIISILHEVSEPLTEEELEDKCDCSYLHYAINTLLKNKILYKQKIENENTYMYYFPMLGEKKGGKK